MEQKGEAVEDLSTKEILFKLEKFTGQAHGTLLLAHYAGWTRIVEVLNAQGWTYGMEQIKTPKGLEWRVDMHHAASGNVEDAFDLDISRAVLVASLNALNQGIK